MPKLHQTRMTTRIGAASLAAVFALTGCEQFASFNDKLRGSIGGSSIPGVVEGPGGTLRIEERDVESPEIFETTDRAIWDGRPSFGGVWAAVPGNVQPERVRIFNIANGQSVVGALFKREAANPGPPIEVSSDAATALAMIPGEPAQLKITALRREAVDVTPAVNEDTGPEPISTTTIQPLVADQTTVIQEVTPGTIDVAAVSAGTTTDIVSTTAATIAAAPDTAVAAAPVMTTPATNVPERRPAAAEAGLQTPFIQVGAFAAKSNAQGLSKILENNSIQSEVRVQSLANGSVLHRVLAGPSDSIASRDVLLQRLKVLGFTDAFTVAR